MSYVSVRKSRKCEENVTSKRCGLATFTECVPLPPEARGLNASTAGSHKTYNSWRARSCFEHTKQAKVGGQSAGPKACLALLAERKQQWMLSRRRERLPFPLSRSPVRTFRVLLGRFIVSTVDVVELRGRGGAAAAAAVIGSTTPTSKFDKTRWN